MKKRSTTFIGILVAVAVIAGVMFIPNDAKAETVNGDNGIVYVKDSEKYDFKTYWNQKEAPVMEGYVFAGWYSEAAEGYALDTDAAASATQAWAKFVPDYVLSVRAQIEAETKENDGKTDIRVLSAVDSEDYLNVGFDIWLANKKQLTMTSGDKQGEAPLITTRAFSNILVNGEKVSATTTFGAAAKYFVVWKLTDIVDVNDNKIIYVRPYWTTNDGTKVEGLAKYVHVEDGYMGYVNVPINLMTGEAIAAGIVKMQYQEGLTFVGFEEGKLLKEMAVNYGTKGVIQMVGNAETVNQEIFADGIYANLRFKKTGTADTNSLIITPADVADFTNWEEAGIEISPVIQY